MNRIKLSIGANCAAEKYCFPLQGKKESKQKWIDANDLFTDNSKRVFALVDTLDQVYFMDAITGSLYRFGDCETSSNLKAHGIKRNHEAKNILMEISAENKSEDDEVTA